MQVALGQMVNVVYFTAMCAFVFGLIATAEFGGSYQRQCVMPVGKILIPLALFKLFKRFKLAAFGRYARIFAESWEKVLRL